ncbi:Lipase 2 [Acholeplasma oculi]|uniref:Alpha/beta hydrolase fold-3 domain containing protein n=1 Tax=Acholeplasma oculi TaxID=35623 RepID=A0A061AAD4_9MOLU|nr:alpha/beta hydrolase [Acholeplasma oculi]CDR30793.1 Alpha/beta hydrolase fold-3 domain containing protein [Acholeplasma oculi]SKC35003.1 Acetyl esterase/lipase [Acholeplasma oculi]SUT89756.1 Lipase 2 [Acholeplasma oculi]
MKITKDMIHPELRLSASFIKFFMPSFKVGTLKLVKQMSQTIKGKCFSKIYYEEKYIKRSDGSLLRLAIYAPLIRKPNKVGLLWMHGGGYGLGIPEMNEKLYKMLIDETDCVIIAPDYTLSIEKPYPAAIDDCYLALEWMKANANLYMINPNQLMIGGESAGGGLTAALSLLARDRGDIEIAFQMPLYPMLDDRMVTESAKFNNDPVWNSSSNYLAWKLYLGELFETEDVPIYAAPARALHYKNLPPTLTYVGSIEAFRDETISYVEKLRLAGVHVEFQIFDGGYHAFDILSGRTSIGIKALEFLLTNFKYATQHYFKENK